MYMKTNLKDKTALITGASSGIGKDMATLLGLWGLNKTGLYEHKNIGFERKPQEKWEY